MIHPSINHRNGTSGDADERHETPIHRAENMQEMAQTPESPLITVRCEMFFASNIAKNNGTGQSFPLAL